MKIGSPLPNVHRHPDPPSCNPSLLKSKEDQEAKQSLPSNKTSPKITPFNSSFMAIYALSSRREPTTIANQSPFRALPSRCEIPIFVKHHITSSATTAHHHMIPSPIIPHLSSSLSPSFPLLIEPRLFCYESPFLMFLIFIVLENTPRYRIRIPCT